MMDPIIRDLLSHLDDTHMHVMGASNTGKSKFLEAILRGAYSSKIGFTVLDWHGTLYRDLIAYLAFLRSQRSVYLLNLAETDFITAYNPFCANVAPEEMSGFVESRIDATIRPFGAASTDDTPRLGRMLYAFYMFMAETGHTLPNASAVLRTSKQSLRRYAAKVVLDSMAAEDWDELANTKDARFEFLAESTLNRLSRLLQPLPIRRLLGRDSDLRIDEIFRSGSILLVNLNPKAIAGKQSARLVAALLLVDYFRAALAHVDDPRQHILVLDEFQEYVTGDVAAMLDQVRKAGLHLVLANQRRGQLAKDPDLTDAVAVEAQIKAVFGGLDYEAAAELAETIRLPSINNTQVVKQYYSFQTTGHELERVTTSSRTFSSSESAGKRLADGDETGWEDERSGTTRGETAGEQNLLVPYTEERLAHEAFRSREEKVSREAAKLMHLDQRHCFLKTPDKMQAEHYLVQYVRPFYVRPQRYREYECDRYRAQGALPRAEHDIAMAESRQHFETKAREALRPKPKASNAPNQPKIPR